MGSAATKIPILTGHQSYVLPADWRMYCQVRCSLSDARIPDPIFVLMLAGLLIPTLRLFCGLSQQAHSTMYYLVGVWIVLSLFAPKVAVCSILFLAFCDPAATLAGRNLGHLGPKLHSNKSLMGSMGAAVVGGVIAWHILGVNTLKMQVRQVLPKYLAFGCLACTRVIVYWSKGVTKPMNFRLVRNSVRILPYSFDVQDLFYELDDLDWVAVWCYFTKKNEYWVPPVHTTRVREASVAMGMRCGKNFRIIATPWLTAELSRAMKLWLSLLC